MATLMLNSNPNINSPMNSAATTTVKSKQLPAIKNTSSLVNTNGRSLLKRFYLQSFPSNPLPSIPTKKPKINIISSVTIPPPTASCSSPKIAQNQKFYVSDAGQLKPIVSSSDTNLQSGVFRTYAKKKAATPSTFTSTQQCLKNQSSDDNIVIYGQGKQSRIVPVDVYNKDTAAAAKLSTVTATANIAQSTVKSQPVSKIVYCIVHPSELKIAKASKNGLTDNEKISTATNHHQQNDSKKRKRKTIQIPVQSIKVQSATELVPIARTRCGRLSKPPNYMKTFDISSELSMSQQHEQPKRNPQISDNVTFESVMENEDNLPPNENQEEKTKVKRQFPDRFKCNTCQKIYLGANKVRMHLRKYPNHDLKLPTETNKNESTKSNHLFDFLLENIHKTDKTEQINFLFSELSDFMTKLNRLRSQLLLTSDTDTSTIQYIDKHVGRALDMEPGNYHINQNVFNNDDGNVNQKFISDLSSSCSSKSLNNNRNEPLIFDSNTIADVFSSTSNNTNHPPIEYNLNISLDSISDSKIIMNLPENISDECLLLQSVEELVKERIKHLPDNNDDHAVVNGGSTSSNVVSFDHINDNAVEAAVVGNHKTSNELIAGRSPVLDLSMDLFRFHTD